MKAKNLPRQIKVLAPEIGEQRTLSNLCFAPKNGAHALAVHRPRSIEKRLSVIFAPVSS